MREELEEQITESKRSRNLKMETTGVVVQDVSFFVDRDNDYRQDMVVTLQLPFRDISQAELARWFVEVYPKYPVLDDKRLSRRLPVKIKDIGHQYYEYVEYDEDAVLDQEEDDEEDVPPAEIWWHFQYLGNDRYNRKSPYLILQVAFSADEEMLEDISKSYVETYLEALR